MWIRSVYRRAHIDGVMNDHHRSRDLLEGLITIHKRSSDLILLHLRGFLAL